MSGISLYTGNWIDALGSQIPSSLREAFPSHILVRDGILPSRRPVNQRYSHF